ncbi:MAG TPA: hypothetical protein VMF35_06110 [Acidimicrobiales bacterium]|nr:hypothetical protein [Acidimicrobiales bacterium]
MLKRLLGRHRSLRIGATLVGASALAIGFASPALAAQNVNNGNADNANAQNYLVVQGGSNTAYLLMQAESDIFNQSPGCDLAGQASPNAQPLDYGCPGLNGEQGAAQPAGLTVTATANITAGSKKFVASSLAGNTNIGPGALITDSAGVIPAGDVVKTFGAATGKLKVGIAATGSATGDTLTVDYNPQQGENGFLTWGQQNPFNDVLVEEPSYGSGNGIDELEGTGNATTVGHSNGIDDPSGVGPVNVSPLDVARSSRAPSIKSGGDYQGLNFVAYAEDAVSYLYWTKYNGLNTDANKCISSIGANNITTAMLKSIWNETYSSGTPSVTWNSLDPSDASCPNTPIYAYWAQNGSGTESTWASATGASFPTSASNWPAKQIIFENETSSILGNNGTGAGHGAPVGDAIFFFSYGKYQKECTPNTTTQNSTLPLCAGTSTNASVPNAVQLGTAWNGVSVNQASINSQLPGLTGSQFPGDRLLYNVYSNGNNPNLPASAPAALNVVSEDGFMCKPATNTEIDPNTGLTYRAEIDTAITNQGFFPLPNLQVEDGQTDTSVPGYNSTATGIPHPAWNDGLSTSKYNAANESGSPWNFSADHLDTDNSAISGSYQAEDDSATLSTVTASPTAPVGYCITETTDGSPQGQ